MINNQDVPAWFLDDYQDALNAMGDNYTKDAFLAGKLYVIGPPGAQVPHKTMVATYLACQKRVSEDYIMSEGKAWGVLFNGHQIVINNQEVPEWFLDDYQETPDAMDDNDTKDAIVAEERHPHCERHGLKEE